VVSQFDSYATEYESALKQNLRFVPGGVDYYYRNRVKIAKRAVRNLPTPKEILDFGAGIGLTIPHLQTAFPTSKISICDESAESVEQAHQRFPAVEVIDSNSLPTGKFDLIFVAGVIHHVTPADRSEVIHRISEALSPDGLLVIYELNPLNPITRRLVRCCPFDEDATLITKRGLKALLLQEVNLRIANEAFMVFLPPLLEALNPLEKLMKWCPFGAQYYVALEKRVGLS